MFAIVRKIPTFAIPNGGTVDMKRQKGAGTAEDFQNNFLRLRKTLLPLQTQTEKPFGHKNKEKIKPCGNACGDQKRCYLCVPLPFLTERGYRFWGDGCPAGAPTGAATFFEVL